VRIAEHLLIVLSQLLSEHKRRVVAPYKIPFPPTEGNVWKFVFVSIRFVQSQTAEKEPQEVFLFEAAGKVFHFRIVEKELQKMF